MKIWVDDVRPVPDDTWTPARTYVEAINLIRKGDWNTVSLDHDLGDFSGVDGREMTGYDILLDIVEEWHDGELPGEVLVHTANPVARNRMIATIDRYFK